MVYDSDSVTLNVISAAQAGDYNADSHVDQLDFDAWRSNYGTTNAAADGNGDAIVDSADYVIWRNRAATSQPGAIAAVPEPHIWHFLITFALCVLSMRIPRGL